MKLCEQCGSSLPPPQGGWVRKFCSIRCKNRGRPKRTGSLNQIRHKNRRLERIAAVKDVPCADCSNRFDSVCMDFDHLPGHVKVNSISQMLTGSWAKVEAEIAKCDIVCANCHRIRTKKRAND